MEAHPDTFAFVQIHHGDAYATTWGNARANFYGLTAYPTSWFDGVTQRVGAKSYAIYEFDYNNRRAVATDVTIDLAGELLTGTTYTIVATVCLEPDGTGKTMRIYMVQVLDHWPGIPTYSRNGFKQAAPTVDITLAPGECQEITKYLTFDATSMASQENIKIISWAQEPSSSGPAEVYQAAKMNWPFPPIFTPCEALAVRSYKDHGDAGVLGLDLGVSGGIEPRIGGIVELEIDLDDASSFSGGVEVDCSAAWAGTADAVVDGDTVTVTFDPALPDEAQCTLTLDCEAEVCVRGLEGDIDRGGVVTTSDASIIKPRFGEVATEANCEFDFDGSGLVTTSDFSVVKPLFGHTAAACP